MSGSSGRLLSRACRSKGDKLSYPRLHPPPSQAAGCTDFAAKIRQTSEIRQKREADAATAKRQREAELRRQRLASILQLAGAKWSGLDPLMDQKIASAYDQVATQLQELRDAYAQADDIGAFQQKLTAFRGRYSNRPAMLRRIEKL